MASSCASSAIFSNDVPQTAMRGGRSPGAGVVRGWFIPALPAGTYKLKITHNAAGGNPDAAQYAIRSVGLASVTDSELTVAPDFGY